MMLIGHELLHSKLQAQFREGGLEIDRAMIRFARTFPTLADYVPAVWDADALERAVYGGGSGALHAARFVLEVFNSRIDWPRLGRFSVSEAFGTWDEAHREAFRAWTRYPWWP